AQVNKMILVDQHEDAAELIKHQDYFSTSLEARTLLITVYENNQDITKALETALDAIEALGEVEVLVKTVARLYEVQGNNEKAIEYYEKFIELRKETEAEKISPEIPYIEAEIDRLR